MEAFGELEKDYQRAGYGPSYESTSLADYDLEEVSSAGLSLVADELRDFDASDLELIATCLWVERIELETDEEAIVDRVKDIKPKYPTQRIEKALQQARDLADRLI